MRHRYRSREAVITFSKRHRIKAKEFITILSADIERMIDADFHYYAFVMGGGRVGVAH